MDGILRKLGVDNAALYTQPEDILEIHQALAPISPMFSIAAAFGNVHGSLSSCFLSLNI
jgi:fructose/tagatose bisphosphate aldolase